MVNYGIVLVDFIGAFFFLGATWYAKKNYDITKGISSYWLLMTFAFAVATLSRFAAMLEWAEIYPLFMDVAENSLAIVCATIFAIVAVLTVVSLVQPID